VNESVTDYTVTPVLRPQPAPVSVRIEDVITTAVVADARALRETSQQDPGHGSPVALVAAETAKRVSPV
jgi:hypothetical protein